MRGGAKSPYCINPRGLFCNEMCHVLFTVPAHAVVLIKNSSHILTRLIYFVFVILHYSKWLTFVGFPIMLYIECVINNCETEALPSGETPAQQTQ